MEFRFGQVALCKINLMQQAIRKRRAFKGALIKGGETQYTVDKRGWKKQLVALVKLQTKQFAVFEFDVSEQSARYIGIAQVAIDKLAFCKLVFRKIIFDELTIGE